MLVGCAPFVSIFPVMSALLGSLRGYRQSKAAATKVPIYCIFGDTVMKSIAAERPVSMQALQAIRGFSDEKCELYGREILELVRVSPPARDDAISAKSRPAVVKRRAPVVQRNFRRPVAITARRNAIGWNREGVYILELLHGRVYVGHSSDVAKRVQQHLAGQGSAFTKAFPPTGVVLPRLGKVSGSPEAAERDETLRYMFLRGIGNVRGWRYVRVDMPDEEMEDAEGNIRELFDLCRRCGHPGHFVSQCKANFDRLGRPCRPRD